MRDNYYTLKSFGTDEIIISKSRFIAHCGRAETEEEAITFINKIKKSIIPQHIIVRLI